MSIFIEQTAEQTSSAWKQIDWERVEKDVRRLQERIYRATDKVLKA